MPASEDPAAVRRRVGRELRSHRISTGRTAGEVARELGLTVSETVALEGGLRIPSDLDSLFGGYGITDAAVVAALSAAAENAPGDRWAEFAGITNSETLAFFSYEASAAVIRWYEPLFVPGLLQIPDYTRALLKGVYEFSDDAIERCVESRRQRRAIIDSEHPSEMFFLVDEAVLRRPVGGADVHRRQLQSLRDSAARPGVSIRAVPFRAEPGPQLLAPFVLLELMAAGEPDLLYLEHRMTATLTTDVRAVCDHLDRFDALAAGSEADLLAQAAGEA